MAGVGLAKQRPPIIVELKAMKIKQYPMSQEARQGITPHKQRLLKVGILKKCWCPWNTPLLPVKKPGRTDFRPIQDLREVNKWVSDIHPTVPNPYTLLSSLPQPGMGTLPPSPIYSPSDLSWMQDNTNRPVGKNGWYQDQNDNLLLPANLGRHLCTHLHQTTHWERKRL